MLSKLPRRPGYYPTVAELVQRYQDNSPTLASVDSIEDIESTYSPTSGNSRFERRNTAGNYTKRAKRATTSHDQSSISDSEQGYAAKVASTYLARRRPESYASRIPGPIAPSEVEILDDREAEEYVGGIVKIRDAEGVAARNSSLVLPANKRASAAEKNKSLGNFRKNSKTMRNRFEGRAHSKVSNIAWRFEQMGRRADRIEGPYTVIRGRRARPVASSSAKVEIFHSVQEAIKDEAELVESSSETDDDDGNVDLPADFETKGTDPLAGPDINSVDSADADREATNDPEISVPPSEELHEVITENTEMAVEDRLSQSISDSSNVDPTPILSSVSSNADIETMSDRHSTFMRALSGLWPPNASTLTYREDLEHEDALMDPEHIFPDCSMVVRINEPTSIIALALKYDFSPHLKLR